MKLFSKLLLLYTSIVLFSPLVGQIKTPITAKEAKELVTRATTSSDINTLQEILTALRTAISRGKPKFPTQINKVNQRLTQLKSLPAARPKSIEVPSPVDQTMILQLQEQLKEKQAELDTAQKVYTANSEEQNKIISTLEQEIVALKKQVQTCQLQRTTPPPLPPHAAQSRKGPPGPPPPDAQKTKQPKAPSQSTSLLLEQIRKGTSLKRPTSPSTKKSTQESDSLKQRLASIRGATAPDEENDDDNSNGEWGE